MHSKKKINFLVIFLIIIIFFLSVLNFKKITNFFTSIHKKTTSYMLYIIDTFASFKYVYLTKKSLFELNKRLLFLETENQLLRIENERLKKLLKSKDEINLKKIKCYARVIGANNDGFIYYYLIDKGKKDGIDEGDGVLANGFVLGRIITLYDTTAKIQLLTDEKSSISVKNERSKITGILTGQKYNRCIINYVPKEEDMKEGDIIVTSNLSKSFPEGIKVGIITEIDRKTENLSMYIKVKPFIDIFSVDIVAIVSK